MIRASAVGYTFASKRVGLASVDLNVDAGELLALLGPNGSGKTTLLRLFCRDLAPTSGKLSVATQRIAFASAQPVHFDELTGAQNARFFAQAMAAGEKAVNQQLTAFDLRADADVPAGEYSFGMQRKLMLAEALAPKPELLLLDEPTIGLDPRALRSLADALQDHVRAGNTVVAATNDVRFAAQATRVVFLHNGHKVADASPQDLLKRMRGSTRIDVTVTIEPARTPDFPARVIATRTAAGFSLQAQDAGALPDVCSALMRAGATIGAVRVHEPDLADVFQELTGEVLSADADV